MKRLITTALILGAITLGANPATAREPGWRLQECRFQFVDGKANWSLVETKATIRCASDKAGVSLSTALYIGYRESHLGQWATNPSSGACGVYQFYPASTFEGRLKAQVPHWMKPWGTSCYNARSNILTAMYTAQSGWGPWGL